jgi:precorrin-8X/cobalt-precorrin-8 methylmutase
MSKIMVPEDIEKKSFEIIENETKKIKGYIPFSEREWTVVRRLIHTTAGFDVLDNIIFHPKAIDKAVDAIQNGCVIITDTNMAKAGISRWRLKKFNIVVHCMVGDEDVAKEARKRGCTRSMVAIERATTFGDNVIFGIGNAPTALFHLLDLIDVGRIRPALIIGMVVGFVGAEEAKNKLINHSPTPYIALKGRKGGSSLVSAAINALLDLAYDSYAKERS